MVDKPDSKDAALATAQLHPDNLQQFRTAGPQAQKDAARVLAIAKDEMNPWRESDMADRHHPLPPMKTSTQDIMAELNRDPNRMDAALAAMQKNPGEVSIKINTDAGGNRQVTFERAGSEDYLPAYRYFSVLNARDEQTVQRIVQDMEGLPEPLSYPQLRDLADTMRTYRGKEPQLDRMSTNLAFELKAAHRFNQSVLGSADYNGGGLVVFGKTADGQTLSYFQTDGRITQLVETSGN